LRSQPGLAPLCLNAEEDDDDSDGDGDDDEEEDGVEVSPMTALISGSNGLDPEYMPVYRALIAGDELSSAHGQSHPLFLLLCRS
jgi:hypothetical protein